MPAASGRVIIHVMRSAALLASLFLALGVTGVGPAVPCPAEEEGAVSCGCASGPSCCCRQADPVPAPPSTPAISSPAPIEGIPAGLAAEDAATVPVLAPESSPAAENQASGRPARFLLACAFLC